MDNSTLKDKTNLYYYDNDLLHELSEKLIAETNEIKKEQLKKQIIQLREYNEQKEFFLVVFESLKHNSSLLENFSLLGEKQQESILKMTQLSLADKSKLNMLQIICNKLHIPQDELDLLRTILANSTVLVYE